MKKLLLLLAAVLTIGFLTVQVYADRDGGRRSRGERWSERGRGGHESNEHHVRVAPRGFSLGLNVHPYTYSYSYYTYPDNAFRVYPYSYYCGYAYPNYVPPRYYTYPPYGYPYYYAYPRNGYYFHWGR